MEGVEARSTSNLLLALFPNPLGIKEGGPKRLLERGSTLVLVCRTSYEFDQVTGASSRLCGGHRCHHGHHFLEGVLDL